MKSVVSKVNIYEYTNYRDYLKSFYDEQKEINPAFSYRNFSRLAGLSSPSYLSMVMTGKRKLTANSIMQFVMALGLGTKQANFFETMVFFNQAKSEKERDYYLDRLISLKPKIKFTALQKDQYDFYNKPFFLAVHQMTYLPGFKEDYEWIAKNVYPAIKTAEAKEAVEVLLRLNMLKRDSEGRLVPTDDSFSTPSEVYSLEIKRYHREMLSSAKEALVEVPRDFRDISSLTVPVAIKDLEKVKERILKFREEMNAWLNESSSSCEEVYQMNIQLFPITSFCWKDKLD